TGAMMPSTYASSVVTRVEPRYQTTAPQTIAAQAAAPASARTSRRPPKLTGVSLRAAGGHAAPQRDVSRPAASKGSGAGSPSGVRSDRLARSGANASETSISPSISVFLMRITRARSGGVRPMQDSAVSIASRSVSYVGGTFAPFGAQAVM